MHQTRSDRLARKKRKRQRLLHKYALISGIGLLLLVGAITIWQASTTGEPPANQAAPTEQQEQDAASEDPAVLPGSKAGGSADDAKDAAKETDTNSDHQSESVQSSVTIALVGDIMMGGRIDTLLQSHGYDYPFRKLGSVLKDADVALGNLENPITDRGEPADKSYVFRTSPEAVPAIQASGLDVLNLANNHTLDYGLEGLRDTIRYLDEAGIGWIGAGENEEEAYAPYLTESNGIRIAFIGLTRVVPEVSWKADKQHPGLAETYDYRRAIAAIEKAKEIADLVVVMVHWGIERQETPEPYMVEYAKRYIDAGADLVAGSHPHVLSGIEHYKGKWIAYSLGNFIFTVSPLAETRESVVLQAHCDASGKCELEFVPMETGIGQPYPASDEATALMIDKMNRLSIGAKLVRSGDRLVFVEDTVNE